MNYPNLRVRVLRKQREALDVATFELINVETGQPLPPFSAGSHVEVHLPNGLTRQYSLCNDPRETHRYLIAVLRAPTSRGGSQALHDGVEEGDELSVSAPKNHFPLAHGAPYSLLFAGGIGVTPVLCMAERLAAAGAPFEMHYCTRSADHTAFLERIRTSSFASQVRFYFDDVPEAGRLQPQQVLPSAPASAHLYVCGPNGFMDWILSAGRAAQWHESRLHYEFFGASIAKATGDESFEVKVASSGRIVKVGRDQSVVHALASVGVDVPVACEQGVCGTCLTRVLEGEPDHRDVYLTPEERAANDQFTPCCSRAKSKVLVLDI